MNKVKDLPIADVKLLMPKLHHDDRGYLVEIIKEETMLQLGLPHHFPQENQSLSLYPYTVRGMHAQLPPAAQGKLVRVLKGSILDVAVDVRAHSPTFGQHVSVTLSENEPIQMYIPPGFLHGFCTLEANTAVLYKMTKPYAPNTEFGVLWNDPDLAIEWPCQTHEAHLSDKDQKLPLLKNCPLVNWS